MFKGPPVKSRSGLPYGDSFGHDRSYPVAAFPSSTSPVHDQYAYNYTVPPEAPMAASRACIVPAWDSAAVARLDADGELIENTGETNPHTYIDECFMQKLCSSLQFNRDHGILELIPIAVVITDKSVGL